eukprot:GILJ01012215.1.p1 GENE.GILJ01012215.1~~GILJ01012215.1.p1  ORF type:complete len:352 (-),score=76.32 GILJ01012215.1:1-1056(-)
MKRQRPVPKTDASAGSQAKSNGAVQRSTPGKGVVSSAVRPARSLPKSRQAQQKVVHREEEEDEPFIPQDESADDADMMSAEESDEEVDAPMSRSNTQPNDDHVNQSDDDDDENDDAEEEEDEEEEEEAGAYQHRNVRVVSDKEVTYDNDTLLSSTRRQELQRERENQRLREHALMLQAERDRVENMRRREAERQQRSAAEAEQEEENMRRRHIEAAVHPSMLQTPAANSSMLLVQQIDRLKTEIDSVSIHSEMDAATAVPKGKVLVYSLNDNRYGSLPPVEPVSLPRKPSIGKQIDPKWKRKLELKPDIMKLFSADRDPTYANIKPVPVSLPPPVDIRDVHFDSPVFCGWR